MPCPDCATPTAPGARFCHQCGRRLDTSPTACKVGDRRVVTALFADLVGYTRLVDELDPEEVRARVDGALALLGEAVVHFGGSLEKFIGDAVLAVFGVPAAHDDDALRACLCALEMQAALARYVPGGRAADGAAHRDRHRRGRRRSSRDGRHPFRGPDRRSDDDRGPAPAAGRAQRDPARRRDGRRPRSRASAWTISASGCFEASGALSQVHRLRAERRIISHPAARPPR